MAAQPRWFYSWGMQDIRKGNCPLCDHHEIIEAIASEFSADSQDLVAAVTYDKRWVIGGRNAKYPHGPLRMYVCRSCGFTQWHADSPEQIPIGDDHRTRIINGVERNAPYR